MTESEMRQTNVPTPETAAELASYVDELVNQEHDYGTCVYAMSMAAVAAFNHVAHKLGVTGFQASCADMDILRRTRGMEGPFMLIDASKMLYPQYDIRKDLEDALNEWRGWAANEAQKMLADSTTAAKAVRSHWRQLADYVDPKEAP